MLDFILICSHVICFGGGLLCGVRIASFNEYWKRKRNGKGTAD